MFPVACVDAVKDQPCPEASAVFRVSFFCLCWLRSRRQRPILPAGLRTVSCFVFYVSLVDAAKDPPCPAAPPFGWIRVDYLLHDVDHRRCNGQHAERLWEARIHAPIFLDKLYEAEGMIPYNVKDTPRKSYIENHKTKPRKLATPPPIVPLYLGQSVHNRQSIQASP